MSKLAKSILKLDKEEVKKVLQGIMECSNEELDKGMQTIGKEIVAGYALGVITEKQRTRLMEYRAYRKEIDTKKLELYLSEQMVLLEQQVDGVNLFQCNVMLGRVVVASVKEISEGGKTLKSANGNILEIYKDQTPKAYHYATNKYQEYVAD